MTNKLISSKKIRSLSLDKMNKSLTKVLRDPPVNGISIDFDEIDKILEDAKKTIKRAEKKIFLINRKISNIQYNIDGLR